MSAVRVSGYVCCPCLRLHLLVRVSGYVCCPSLRLCRLSELAATSAVRVCGYVCLSELAATSACHPYFLLGIGREIGDNCLTVNIAFMRSHGTSAVGKQRIHAMYNLFQRQRLCWFRTASVRRLFRRTQVLLEYFSGLQKEDKRWF